MCAFLLSGRGPLGCCSVRLLPPALLLLNPRLLLALSPGRSVAGQLLKQGGGKLGESTPNLRDLARGVINNPLLTSTDKRESFTPDYKQVHAMI